MNFIFVIFEEEGDLRFVIDIVDSRNSAWAVVCVVPMPWKVNISVSVNGIVCD